LLYVFFLVYLPRTEKVPSLLSFRQMLLCFFWPNPVSHAWDRGKQA